MDPINTVILDSKINLFPSVDYVRHSFLRGEVVAFPTETVYGLGCDITNESAVNRIYELKGRPVSNPLTVYIHKPELAAGLCMDVPEEFYKLAEELLPGPLAIVMRKREGVPGYINSNLDTISIRIPDNEFVFELLTSLCRPMVGTSANLSGGQPPKTFKEVLDTFRGKIPIAVDGGDCPLGVESTIISLAGDSPTLIRKGSVPLHKIELILKMKLK